MWDIFERLQAAGKVRQRIEIKWNHSKFGSYGRIAGERVAPAILSPVFFPESRKSECRYERSTTRTCRS
jgi:hypothetical protein